MKILEIGYNIQRLEQSQTAKRGAIAALEDSGLYFLGQLFL